MKLTVVERINRLTQHDPATGCIEWTGSLAGGGYAQIKIDRRAQYAHRVAWEMVHGPIPEGMYLDHLCRNRKCVNAAHLEPVSFRENVLRGVGPTATNATKTACPEGHPYSIENTYTNPAGSRVCRTCKGQRERERRARLKSSVYRKWVAS